MGVVNDEQGNLFVSDRKAGKVFEIRDGKVETLVRGLDRPVGLAFDSWKRLLIVEEGTGRLLRVETDGTLTSLVEGMNDPRWLADAEDGTVYISAKGIKEKKDRDRNKDDDDDDDDGGRRDDDDENGDDDDEDEKKKHKSHGEVILRLTTDDQLSVFAYGFKDLEGLAVGTDVLFASAQGHRELRRRDKEDDDKNDSRKAGGIFEIPILPDRTAGPITRLTRNRITRPVGLVLDRLGALYVTAKRIKVDKKVKHAIGKVALDSAVSRFASGLKNARGMALDSSGNLYVAVGKGSAHGHDNDKDDDKGKRRGQIIRFRAPSPPEPTVPAFTNQSPITIPGITGPDSRIDAFLNDATTPITIFTPDGSFSLTLDLLRNGQNSLSVFTTAQNGLGLTSAPAQIFTTHDDMAPAISNLQPASGSFVNVQDPLIRADFFDNLSGIDIASVVIKLNGFPNQATITDRGFMLTPQGALAEGSNTVSVTLFDLAGNMATASSTFTVDVTAPVISDLSPADGEVVTTTTPVILATFSDDVSGINVSGVDTNSVTVFVNGTDFTSQATITATGFTLDCSNGVDCFDPLQDTHTVIVTVSDRTGNSATASSTFTIASGLVLNEIGPKTANVGSTLSFTLTARNESGPLTFSVSPLPLPANASLDAKSGLFTFKPDAN